MKKVEGGINGIDLFREYFNRQMFSPLSAPEQSIMTHIIWLMNEARAEEVQITLKQLSAKSNVDVRTLKAKLPQLCSKNYLERADFNGDVCTLATNLLHSCREKQGVPTVSAPKYNKYNKDNKDNKKVVNLNAGECKSALSAGSINSIEEWEQFINGGVRA